MPKAKVQNTTAASKTFTWQTLQPPDGDWGVFPKSGPYNLSGTWGGVIGIWDGVFGIWDGVFRIWGGVFGL